MKYYFHRTSFSRCTDFRFKDYIFVFTEKRSGVSTPALALPLFSLKDFRLGDSFRGTDCVCKVKVELLLESYFASM